MASESSMDVDGGSSIARTGAGAEAGAQQQQRQSWRPRLVAYAATGSSSASGSLSTTYTSGSSHVQSCFSGDGGLAPLVALSRRLDLEEERGEMRRYIMCLVQEFLAAAGDDKDAAALVLERWFSDLSVSWVLGIATDDKSPAAKFIFPRRLDDLAQSWIDALSVIQLSIFIYFNGLSKKEEDAFSPVPTAEEFAQVARFLQSAFLKMLPFADAVMSLKVIGPSIQHNLSTISGEEAVPAEKKLEALLGVRDVLSDESQHIQQCFSCSSFEGSSKAIIEQTSSVLSAKLAMLDEAIWDTLDEVRTSITPMMDNHNAADSPGIHKHTMSIVNCSNVISANYGLVNEIVSEAASLGNVPQDNTLSHPLSANPTAMLIRDMVSSLQENLARVSQPFPDQSLRFLFLLNNTHFMWQQLRHVSYVFELYVLALDHKIHEHMERYLQMSWIPMVSALHDPTPLCLGRYSPLVKFELDFQKTYSAQKLWKVPDPELRRRLRNAIIDTVIPAFTKYLKDNKINAPPRVTQQELEDMVQDLFEG